MLFNLVVVAMLIAMILEVCQPMADVIRGDPKSGKEFSGELVAACCDAAAIPEASDHALHQVAFTTGDTGHLIDEDMLRNREMLRPLRRHPIDLHACYGKNTASLKKFRRSLSRTDRT